MSATIPLSLSVCSVDLGRRQVLRGGKPLTLSTREAELLAYLVSRPGLTVTREELYREVWGYARGAASRTLDVTVQRLREKVEGEPAEPRHLVTVRGVGYRFEPLTPSSGEGPPGARRGPEPSPLLGRAEDLAAIEEAVDRGVALLSILGPPGVGKSRLAAELAARRPTLLVLDSPDQAEVRAALEGRATTTVLATSLQPFRLRGEQRHGLLPLGAVFSTELLELQLERRRLPGLAARRPAFDELVAALGGNPALLEALGAKLGERATAIGLDSALRELSVERWIQSCVLDPRGRFHAALEATWQALGPGARQMLCRVASETRSRLALDELLSVGRGGGAATGPGDPDDGADDLQDLLDHAALLAVGEGGERSFLLPRPLRSYVLSRSAATIDDTSHS